MLTAEQINELLKLDDNALVNQTEAAAVLGLKPSSLQWYRHQAPERSPRFRVIGSRSIRYRMGDLRAYIATRSEG